MLITPADVGKDIMNGFFHIYWYFRVLVTADRNYKKYINMNGTDYSCVWSVLAEMYSK